MTGKTVLITGANKSIGYQTARQLGRLGYRIWLGSRDAARGALATETLSSEGIDVRAIAIDVMDDDSVQNAVAAVQAADGKLDVLINSAGIPGGYAAPGEQNPDRDRNRIPDQCLRPDPGNAGVSAPASGFRSGQSRHG
jgi:NAD(P)-dependent dehydrogenase (short-subunit alcohol dehydrogenase family)